MEADAERRDGPAQRLLGVDAGADPGAGLERVAAERPGWLLDELTAAALLGRGGAFFPVADKWRAALAAAAPRVVVANGAEDEPGSLKDRVLLAARAELVLEGGLLTAGAVGADRLLLYINVEATDALQSARTAVDRFAAAGLLGGLSVSVVEAPPAYVAGEDSAAVEFIEKQTAQPRKKPPYPATEGIGGAPTVVANVETLAHVALVGRHGADWFRGVGSADLTGTMLVTLPAACARPGVYEVPGGAWFDEVVSAFGGGVPGGLRGAQVGGPAAGWIASDFHVRLTPAALRERGSMLGCGAVRILTDDACAVDAVAEIEAFFARESCGKCPPCRMETQLFAKVLGGLRDGRGITRAQVDKALQVSEMVSGTTDCALARFPAPPLATALALFADDFEAHLAGRDCGRTHAGGALRVGDGITPAAGQKTV